MIHASISEKQANPENMLGTRKTPLSCLRWSVLRHVGLAMPDGAFKYGRLNHRAA